MVLIFFSCFSQLVEMFNELQFRAAKDSGSGDKSPQT
jgi:hypothetical protein